MPNNLPILYKKDSTGAIRQWHIDHHVDDDSKYRMVSGQLNGQLVSSEWTQAKANSLRSALEQARFESAAAYKKKKKEGYHDTVELASTEPMHFFEPMLAKKYEDYSADLHNNPPLFSQPKLDGIRCIARRDELRTRTGESIVSCSHIANALRGLPGNIILDGELYNHDLREDFNTIASLVRKTKGYEKVQDKINAVIQYHVYDIYLIDQPEMLFGDRLLYLHNNILPALDRSTDMIQVVETMQTSRMDGIDEHYGKVMQEGYEGQIVRLNKPYENKRSQYLLKRKEFQDAEFIILDVLEGIGNRSGMAGALLLQLGDGRTFQSGIKGGRDHYRYLLAKRDQFVGKPATIRYFHLTPDGIPRFPVAVDVGRRDL